MKLVHCFVATLAGSSIIMATIAACGGGGMAMPPPTSGPTQTSAGQPSEVDPNLHVTLPPASTSADPAAMPAMGGSQAQGGMAGMSPGKGPAAAPGSMGAMDGGRAMTGMGKPAAPAMDGGMPMDGGMKMGCCGDAPMPMPAPKGAPPAPPMPMKPHGEGHM